MDPAKRFSFPGEAAAQPQAATRRRKQPPGPSIFFARQVRKYLLPGLEAAGAAGLKKTPLLGKIKKTQAAKLAELESLVARREVVRIGTEKSPVFVLRCFYNPLELAYTAIAAKAIPGTPRLYTDKEFGVGLARHVKEQVPDAIRLLQGERKLVRVQRARSVYYLHTAALLPLVDAVPSESASRRPEVSWEQVHRAYETAVRESGFSDVLIVDLQRTSGIALEDLKPFLLAQSRAGRLTPSRGDWSLADAPARAAAIELQGEPYLRVRLI